MSDGGEEVYRRRKSRVENGQRVIGGLGKRRPSQSSAGFKDRLQQFDNNVGDSNNDIINSPQVSRKYSSDNPLSPGLSRRRGDGISSPMPTRRASVDSTDGLQMPRRRRTSQTTDDQTKIDPEKKDHESTNINSSIKTTAGEIVDWRSKLQKNEKNDQSKFNNSSTSPLPKRRSSHTTSSSEDNNLSNVKTLNHPMKIKEEANDWRSKLKSRDGIGLSGKIGKEFSKQSTSKLSLNSTTNKSEERNSEKTDNTNNNFLSSVQKNHSDDRPMSPIDSASNKKKRIGESPKSSFDSISKINSIKNRLYDVNNNDIEGKGIDSDASDRSSVSKKASRWKENQAPTKFSPRSSVENISKWNNARNKFVDEKDKTTQIETTASINWNRKENLNSHNIQSKSQSDEYLSTKSKKVSDKIEKLTNKHLTKSPADKSTASNDQNNIEICVSSPGLTRRTIQSQNKLSSAFKPSHLNLNLPYEEKKDLNKDYDENVTKAVTEKDQELLGISVPNNTGVKLIDNQIHAEINNLTNQNERSQQKTEGVTLEQTKVEFGKKDSVKSRSKNGFNEESKLFDFTAKSTNIASKVNKLSNKTHSSNNANFQKYSKNYLTQRILTTRDRSNTWTTTDSEEEKNQSGDNHTLVRSNSSDAFEEQGSNRRRRLTKKRSKGNKVKIIPRNSNLDTSDGDNLESNDNTSDEFNHHSKADTDINSDADILESKQNDIYKNNANENIEILTSQYSEQKNKTTIESNFNNKKEPSEKLTERISRTTDDVSTMKSSSMTAVSEIRNLTSFSTNDMGGSRSEDESAKLSNWNYKKIKDGPSGSFTSIAKVSTLKLQSFPATPALFSPPTKQRTTEEKTSTASYSEISNLKNGITASPFVFTRSKTFGGGDSGRYSDGEQELSSRLEVHEQAPSFTRSATLPRNMTFKKGIDIRKNPFSMSVKTPKEKEESERDAEILKNLPNSPFALLGRFTRDTQKMQSRSTGSIGDSNFTEIEKAIDYEIDTVENRQDEINELPPSIDLINNNVLPSLNKIIKGEMTTSIAISSPPDIPKDNIKEGLKSNSKVVSKPVLSLTSLKNDVQENDEDYYKYIIDSPVPIRRPSYIRAQNAEETEDPICSLVSQEPLPSEEEQNDISKLKKPGRRARPAVPWAVKTGTEQTDGDVSEIKTKETQDSDSDEPPLSDFKSEIERVETLNKKISRPRPPLAQPPILAGIPEEKGVSKDEPGRKRRPRRPVLAAVFPEETIAEEPTEIDCDSPKTADEHETGYHSQGSDFQSTPKDLSIEDLSENGYDSKLNEDSHSKCDAIPPVLSEEANRLIDNAITIAKLKSCISDSNLVEIKQPPSVSIADSERKCMASTVSIEDNVITHSQDAVVSPKPPPEDDNEHPKPPPTKQKAPKSEMRRHVLQNLLDTERSYVTNLGTLLSMFLKPLKKPENSHIIESNMVDEIFFQIPEILVYHESFLEQLTNRVNAWSDLQIIGDIFVTSFTKNLLMDAYSSFITHFVQAKTTIRQATNARPQFVKYIEQCTKEHREKLTLSDLLIMPVQRIPRYVLLLKDMLKYTSTEHPDYGNLQLALGEIKTLADRMNKGEVEADQAERDVERVRDIEATIEGISDLVSVNRKFIRQDLVAEMKGSITKKDRCLFLFSDLLVCTTVRRKTHALRRGSLGLFTGQSAAELNRYKFLWKLPLDDVEISKANNPQANTGGKEIEVLEEDIKIMNNMLSLSENMSTPHQNIDIAIKELLHEVRNHIQDKLVQSPQLTVPSMHSKIELLAQTDDDQEYFTFIFLSGECKTSWEAYFVDAKRKLAYSRDSFPPEFQRQLPITKTRSGMQFTCAAPNLVNGFNGIVNQNKICGDVWVCNSDGYVGQVCLLSMVPDAKSKACLSVCSANIVCVTAVPGARLNSSKAGEMENNIRSVKSPFESSNKRNKKKKKSIPSDSEDDDTGTGAEHIMAFDSSDDEGNDIGMSPYLGGPSYGGRMSPDGSSLGTADSMEHDSSDFSSEDDDRDNIDSTQRVSVHGSDMTRRNNDFSRKDSYDDLLDANLDEQATMWLGTEDGHIYVFHAQDAIIHRKYKRKIPHSSPVTAILYFESKVFVALASGILCIYKRSADNNGWQISSPQKIQVSITGLAIVCMTAVAGRIWCGCQNTIVLVNASSLKLETTITVSPDHNKSVYKIVSSGLGVWVSVQNSTTLRLYHATTYESLVDIDVAPAVHKMLAGADAIIRQHKAARLRVTSLLICKDLLWIGTSAGVILTNPLPSITASTSVLRHSPGPTGSPHGHTGHVRFLTSVEVPKNMFKGVENDKETVRSSPLITSNKSHNLKIQDHKTDDVTGIVTLVVSGGDGCEDFRNTQQNETIGRDDSTNHLLLWRV